MNIVPSNIIDSYRTGYLQDVTVQDIIDVLGFTPNVDDDPAKVENSWAFVVEDDDGYDIPCAIWDWKGSHIINQFSTYGPAEIFEKLFPTKVGA